MEMKHQVLIGISLILILSTVAIYSDSPYNLSYKNDTSAIFQISTLNALSEGQYTGMILAGDLKKYGDTGMGTLEGLDGEMIELDDTMYQIKSDGNVYLVNDSAEIPFAMVTPFKSNKVLFINAEMNYTQLQQYLNASLPSKNIYYSFKITGTFDSVKARSPPKQYEPYPNLTKALKNQSIFNFNNINGTMVGFWYPQSASSINLNDYHFHFISADKKSGGHVLDCKLKNVIIEIDYISDAYVMYSQTDYFLKFNLTAS